MVPAVKNFPYTRGVLSFYTNMADDQTNQNAPAEPQPSKELRGFAAVAGLKDLKEMLTHDVIEPLQRPEKFIKFNLQIPNGILLFGAPGCGKTFIVNALAEELGYNLIEVRPSDVESSAVHGSVGKIAQLFADAKKQSPAIVFIDEIDALVPKRENVDAASQYKQEEVNEFLTQLNNASESRVLVVGATNRPYLVDTAILRSGRMDKLVYIPPPDFETRKELFRIHLSSRPYDPSIDIDVLAAMTANYVSSDIELIVVEAAREAFDQDLEQIDYDLLLKEIKKTPPSVSTEELDRYEKFTLLERK